MNDIKTGPTAMVLVPVCIAQFMVPFMLTAVGVALPSLGRDFRASAVQLGLVDQLYALSLAMTMLTFGRLGDIVGRRKVFLCGPAFSVRLSGKALVRFPMADRRPIAVRSLPQTETWPSIAALNWPRHRVAGLNRSETATTHQGLDALLPKPLPVARHRRLLFLRPPASDHPKEDLPAKKNSRRFLPH